MHFMIFLCHIESLYTQASELVGCPAIEEEGTSYISVSEICLIEISGVGNPTDLNCTDLPLCLDLVVTERIFATSHFLRQPLPRPCESDGGLYLFVFDDEQARDIERVEGACLGEVD